MDRLFYESLDLIRRHARIDYLQVGHHDLLLEVKGTGLIATLLRSVVRGFNVKKRIRTLRTNAHCLPQPKPLAAYYLRKIYGMYAIVWLLIVLETYVKRLNPAICAFYYRRRQKKRILFLYNETLKRRIGYFRWVYEFRTLNTYFCHCS